MEKTVEVEVPVEKIVEVEVPVEKVVIQEVPSKLSAKSSFTCHYIRLSLGSLIHQLN